MRHHQEDKDLRIRRLSENFKKTDAVLSRLSLSLIKQLHKSMTALLKFLILLIKYFSLLSLAVNDKLIN